MSRYGDLEKCLGIAMGKVEAAAAQAAAEESDDETSSAEAEEALPPEEQIQAQADKLARCINAYLAQGATEVVDGEPKVVAAFGSGGSNDWPTDWDGWE